MNEVAELYGQGWTIKEIQSELSMSRHFVRKALQGILRSNSESKKLWQSKRAPCLSDEQKEMIYGTLLGDASITRTVKDSWMIQINHCEAQRPYLEHIQSQLRGPRLMRTKPSNWGRACWRLCYQNKPELSSIASIVLRTKKTVSPEWMERVTARSIAYWFMDDGSSSWIPSGNSFATFATQSYSANELDLLRTKLISFGIPTTLQRHSHGGMGIYIPVPHARSLFDLVRPYVWPIECMRYKLKG